MNLNYELNKEKVLNDYYKCIGAFINCSLLYKNKNQLIIKERDTDEEKQIKKGRIDDLLSNLGKVGEKAFKYIYGLEILNTYPNLDTISFESFFKKENSLKDFAEKHGINRNNEELLNLINYKDANNQKSHNFDYWFSIIDLIMDDISKKFKKYIEYQAQSTILINYCKEENDYTICGEYSLPFLAALFPNINVQGFDSVPSLNDKQLEKIVSIKREVIKKSGDIFTRFRYAANNPDKKIFSLEEVYSIIKDLINFIEMIHFNNDDLNFDLDREFSKRKIIDNKYKLGISDEEIKNLFTLNIDLESIFANKYKYNSIKKLLDAEVSKEDINLVMYKGLTSKNIQYFRSIGINDYREMRKLLDKYLEDGIPITKKLKKNYID